MRLRPRERQTLTVQRRRVNRLPFTVGRGTESFDHTKNAIAIALSAVQAFEHNDTRAVCEYDAVAALVESAHRTASRRNAELGRQHVI
jgi:hypothetical protein